MEKLKEKIKKAKQELKNKLNISSSPGMELEYSEMKELEMKLKKYILMGEKILKENNKRNK